MPFAVNKGVKIRYELEGREGAPAIMLQHGFGSSLESWYDDGYVEDLGRDFRLILVDCRGHGQSDKPREAEAYGPELIASDYTNLLDNLNLKKCIYYGYSMGGNIAWRCLARYVLNRFSAFICGGSTPYGYTTLAEKEFGEGITAAVRDAARKGAEAWLEFLISQGARFSKDQKTRILRNSDPEALLAHRLASVDLWPGAADILPKINIPVLVYTGEEDAYFIKNREAVKILPKAQFISFPGLDHLGTSHNSAAVLPHIKKFLKEITTL